MIRPDFELDSQAPTQAVPVRRLAPRFSSVRIDDRADTKVTFDSEAAASSSLGSKPSCRWKRDMNHDTVTELPLEECWELLLAHAMGRLAFHLANQVQITPINYVIDKDTLLFRTAEGSKLLGVVMNDDVAFEIDGENGHIVWSVIVRGTAKLLDASAAHRVDDLSLHPWVGSFKSNVIAITPTAISGRRFALDEHARHPWLGR